MKTVLVTGASGLLGTRLVKNLARSDYRVIAVGRGECVAEIQDYCYWQRMDMTQSELPNLNVETLIHAAPLWLLPSFFTNLCRQTNLQRCIAFSSTSVESKADSIDSKDRELAQKLSTAEMALQHLFESRIDYTIFRPTMIYGYSKDENISTIARFIARFYFFPIAGKASGLRQPLHVDDLVKASLDVIENKNTFSKIYDLTGGETLSYRAMVTRIFKSLNRPIVILPLPVFLYRVLLSLNKSGYSRGVANRMNQDLSYNSDAAASDFGYQAQKFLTEPKRDLPQF